MTTINFHSEFVSKQCDVVARDSRPTLLVVAAVSLWLSQTFVTQPGVGSKRMEREIIWPF
jgi:hypothetical protein